ncbi:MAG: vitamin K epoxide reductase family protein [bacterium]|nr:vitamin K epoxide reductase family protein [bacterium]
MNQNLLILILALAGFAVSFNINRKKSNKEKLVCLIGEDCDRVVHSRYATTFGIDNQIFGMIFYSGVAIFSATLIGGLVWPAVIILLFKLAIIGAALFSIYLIGIQAFILKEWCEWCLVSALFSIFICLLNFL